MMNKKPVLIVEHCKSGLTLNEQSKSESSKYLMEGVFTEFGVENRNNRIYTADKFLPHLNELLERKKTLSVIFGEFDHPEVFDTSLSRVSHVVENAWFNKEKNRIDGQIVLLNTHWGREAKAIVNDGYPIFVSSRAAGVTESNGHVELKKLFTYDCVADPGFASAKMNLKSMNESFGITDDAVRIYEADDKMINKINKTYSQVFDLSDESKTNQLFNMNPNDMVTKKQISEYSNYLVNEINTTKTQLEQLTKGSKMVPEKVEELAGYYEALQEQNKKVIQYLDYLADKMQVVVNENKQLKEKSDKLVKHNDYLAENLEKSINYQNYLAENLDKSIVYQEYIAEQLDKNISYAEYLAENLEKNIDYSEYLAENLDKSIDFADYIVENLESSIKYQEYLAENLDTSISFQEYIAESVEKGIKYSEYVAECADKTMSYAGMIAEKLSTGSSVLNESITIESPAEFLKGGVEISTASTEEVTADTNDTGVVVPVKDEVVTEMPAAKAETMVEEEEAVETEKEEEEMIEEGAAVVAGALTQKIDMLIAEAKKREASKQEEPHFYKFLNRSQIQTFEQLTSEEQENVKVALNESSYFSAADVLRTIKEVLNAKKPSAEETLISSMPTDLKPVWESLSVNEQQSIVAQSKFYDLSSELMLEHFWKTRKFVAINKLNENKALIEKTVTSLNENQSLTEAQIQGFFNRIKY